jgi:hypothetical protein
MGRSESPELFVASRPGTEAAIMRIGLNSTQVVFVAPSGEWLRFVVESPDQARDLCLRLEVEAHDGYPDHLRQRIGTYERSPQDWAAAPYPERAGTAST